MTAKEINQSEEAKVWIWTKLNKIMTFHILRVKGYVVDHNTISKENGLSVQLHCLQQVILNLKENNHYNKINRINHWKLLIYHYTSQTRLILVVLWNGVKSSGLNFLTK